jgi:ABC-type Mn2+/Zn2+ transport system ATPase subunit
MADLTTASAPGSAGRTDGGRAVAVRLVGVSAGYGDRLALEDVTLTIPAGSLLAVIGPNGAGKSTLLKTMAGLLPTRSGTVEILGDRPGAHARRVAYVPQAETVDWEFPVTVGEVVMMGRYARIGIARGPGRHDHHVVGQVLETVGMHAALEPSPPSPTCTSSTSR